MNFLLGWNPLVMSKYGMADYGIAEIAALEANIPDIAEIAALEADFPDIKVYLCDFHREQSLSR